MPPKKEADMELYAAIDLHSNNSVFKSTEFSAGFTPPCTGVMVFDPAIN